MLVKYFLLFLISFVLHNEITNGDSEVEKIIQRIENCTKTFFSLRTEGGTEADKIFHELILKSKKLMRKKITSIENDVRLNGKIEKININAILYNITYTQLLALNATERLKENIRKDTSIEEDSKQILYISVENYMTSLTQYFYDMKTLVENRTVNICIDRLNKDEMTDLNNISYKYVNQFEKNTEETKIKFQKSGKDEEEIGYLVSFIPTRKS